MDVVPWGEFRRKTNSFIDNFLVAFLRCVPAGMSGLEDSVDALP